MAIGAGIKAGKAFVEFVLSDKKLDGQLASIGKKFTKFGSIGAAATGTIVAGFAAAALTFANVGSALADMQGRTQVSATQLAELGYAADQTGTDLGTVEKALRAMTAKGLDPNTFTRVAEEIAAIEDPTLRAQAAMEAFGTKTGAALLPMLADLPQLTQHFRNLGLEITANDVAAADALGDALGDSKKQFDAFVFQIGAAIAGPLTELLTWSQGYATEAIEFVKNNKEMVTAIAGVTVAVGLLSAAGIALGAVLTLVSLHPIVAFLTVLAAAITGVVVWVAATSKSFDEFKTRLWGVLKVVAPGLALLYKFADALGLIQLAMDGLRAGWNWAKSFFGFTAAATVDAKKPEGASIEAQAKATQQQLQSAVRSQSASNLPTAAAAGSSSKDMMNSERLLPELKQHTELLLRIATLVGRSGGFVAGTA